VPEFRKLTGSIPKWPPMCASFRKRMSFSNRVTDLLLYLLPHYIEEGKGYLTVAFGAPAGSTAA